MSEYWTGWAQLQKGDSSGAKAGADKIANFVKEEQHDSFFLDFHHLLNAEIDLSRGDYGAADDALKKVSHNTSKYSPHFRALQARLQTAAGDHSAAIRTYGNMCNEVFCSNYEAMGDEPRAIEYYEKALDQWKHADEDLPELIDTRNRLANLRTSN
jgi:tetratricopeptide (TPR) repeat protein